MVQLQQQEESVVKVECWEADRNSSIYYEKGGKETYSEFVNKHYKE